MQTDRFFQSTRGKIVNELHLRGSATALELAEAFGLTPNAVRQHLASLEDEGLVVEEPIRRGPTKPTLAFSLTPAADRFFPQQYDRMLRAVLEEVRAQSGDDGVNRIFAGIAKRATQKTRARIRGNGAAATASALTEVLREGGVRADFSLIDGGFELREHNCPYSSVVKEHPEVCSVIHNVLDETAGGEHTQTQSLAAGGKACVFEVKTTP